MMQVKSLWQKVQSKFKNETRSKQADCKISVIDIAVYLFVILFASWLMTGTFGYDDGHIKIASKLWSDFGAHIPLIRSFSHGQNYPPEYTTFSGEPIRYHYFFYLLVGLLEKAGLNIGLAVNLMSIIGFALLMIMIYQTAKLIFKSAWVGVLSLYLFLFNGSLTFLSLHKMEAFAWHPLAILQQVVNLKHFLNFGPWNGDIINAFNHLNIYTNQRHLGLSLGLVFVVIWPLLKYKFEKKDIIDTKWLMMLWFIMAFFPVTNMAGFVIAVMVGAMFFLFALINRNLDFLKRFAPVYLMAGLFALPAFLSMPSGDFLKFYLGFLSKERTLFSTLVYWWYNLGLYVFLFPVVLIFLKKKYRQVLIAFILPFLVANTFWLSADIINNHKLVNFSVIGLNIFVASLILAALNSKVAKVYVFGKLSKNFSWFEKMDNKGFVKLLKVVMVVIVVFFLSFSGWCDFFPIYNDNVGAMPDYPQNETIAWIMKNTKAPSSFLTTTYLYNPASLAGRKLFMDYGYFNWSMGYDDYDRKQDLKLIFADDISKREVCHLLIKNDLDYILISPGEDQLQDVDVKESVLYRNFEPIYEFEDGYILMATDECRREFDFLY